MIERIKRLCENRKLDEHSFNAESNPNCVRKKISPKRTVLSGPLTGVGFVCSRPGLGGPRLGPDGQGH